MLNGLRISNLVFLVILLSSGAAVLADADSDDYYPTKIVGDTILKQIGVNQPSDIEYLVIGRGVKITWETDPALITRFYAAFRGVETTAPVTVNMPPPAEKLLLRLKNGQTIRMAYQPLGREGLRNYAEPYMIHLYANYYSRDLLVVLADIAANAPGRERDAHLPELAVSTLRVIDKEGRSAVLTPESRDAAPIMSIAEYVVSTIDPRVQELHRISDDELAETAKEQGTVILRLRKPIHPCILVCSSVGDILPNPCSTDCTYTSISCDSISLSKKGRDWVYAVLRHEKSGVAYRAILAMNPRESRSCDEMLRLSAVAARKWSHK